MPAGLATRLAVALGACALLGPATGCRSTVHAARHQAKVEPVDAQGRPTAAAFFRSPLIAHAALSPDGTNLAGVIERGGVEIVFVRAVAGHQIRPLGKLERTDFRSSMQIRSLGWGSDERVLVSIESPSSLAVGVRARQTRLMVLDLDGSAPRYLGKNWPHEAYSQFQDSVIAWSIPDAPGEILLNWPDAGGSSARRADVKSGSLEVVTRGRLGLTSWHANHLGQVLAGSGASRTGTELFTIARAGPNDSFDELIRFDPFEEPGFTFAAFSETPGQIYVYSVGETDLNALRSYDLATRSLGPVVYANPEVDVDGVWTSRRDGHLIAAYYTTDRPHGHFFDDAMQRDLSIVDGALRGTTNEIVDMDLDERVALIRSSADVVPPRFYFYDRVHHRLRLLFDAYPDLKPEMLSPMRPVRFEARDGLVIHGYLTRPKDAPPGPLPLIVLPHGGPTARDVWGWNPEVQFLASRGFAVLQLNFRGSTGYGQHHEQLGYKQWGLGMQDDITDATRWAIAQGIADPARIGIYGASYGGYAALMAMVKTPELFRAGASLAGVSDILEMLDNEENYVFSDFNTPTVGDTSEDREQLAATSPARHADRVRGPILIGHGTEDPIVHVNQAHRMIDALEKAGREVEYHLYDGEVHGFLDERNAIDFYSKLAAFFERHLLAAQAPASPGAEAEPGAGAEPGEGAHP